MNKKLYNLMDWAAIEEVVYGEACHPEEILGVHMVGKSSLIQAFFPGAKKITLLLNETKTIALKDVNEIKMEEADEAGFFAALVPGTIKAGYKYQVEYDKKRTVTYEEPYMAAHVITEEEAENITKGSGLKTYKKLGAHVMTVNKVSGVGFTVWAPNAMRVSVVGDFNNWNGLTNQMSLIGNTGIFELFVPGLSYGDNYKFEILVRSNETVTKADPYAFSVNIENEFNSVVTDLDSFTWQDGDWLFNRKSYKFDKNPVNIYELNLGAYLKAKDIKNVKKAAKEIATYVKKQGYTHIELMPIAEYANDDSLGFATCNYYALSARHGSPSDYMSFINEIHKAGIGVILQWTVNAFDNSEKSFARFDGSALFEHEDSRKGIDARTGMYVFNYARPEVKEYLLSNLIFLVDKYHFDGFKFNDVTSMLYLDYFRNDGEWAANIYGTNENLEAMKFLKECNYAIHDKKEGIITIADDKSAFPFVTMKAGLDEKEKEQCLGFDMTINSGFNQDVISYMKLDPIMRSGNHDSITLGSIYQYKENYLYSISHSDTDFGKGGLICQMPGNDESKYANLKALYGYMMTNPGKKMNFSMQEMADYNSFGNEWLPDFTLAENETNKAFNDYIVSLNKFYKDNAALFEQDYLEKGFEWINNMAADDNVISFVRNGKNKDEILVILLNFANKSYEKYKIGVPKKGKYTEVFNSDKEEFGGTGLSNIRDLLSRKEKCDGREESIRVKLAPLSLTIFRYKALTEKELKEISKREEAKEAKRSEREAAKALILKERENKRKALMRERSRIKDTLKTDLEKKIAAAEKSIAEGSEYKKKK